MEWRACYDHLPSGDPFGRRLSCTSQAESRSVDTRNPDAHAVHAREHPRGLPRRRAQPPGEPDRPPGSADRQGEVRHLRRRERGRAAGVGARVPQRRLALGLLSRSDLHAGPRRGDARGVLRAALRRHRHRERSVVRRPLHERALRLAAAQSRRHVEEADRELQHLRRRLADRLADAAPRRTGVGVAPLSRARKRRRIFLTQRRRDRVGHDRQRQLRRGDVLGVAERRRRPRHPVDRFDLG